MGDFTQWGDMIRRPFREASWKLMAIAQRMMATQTRVVAGLWDEVVTF